MTDVTLILNAIEQGDARAADELLPLVYQELRRLAAQKMTQEPPGQTLQATALVHDAYVRLVEAKGQNWNSRGHFFKAAAEAMRRILVENARRKKTLKRGGHRQRVELDESLIIAAQGVPPEDLLALNDALDRLSEQDMPAAELIKLRIFGGLSAKEAAQMLDISTSKASRDIEYACAWLRLEMGKSDRAC